MEHVGGLLIQRKTFVGVIPFSGSTGEKWRGRKEFGIGSGWRGNGMGRQKSSDAAE
jgi:hypothetical protein